MGGAVTGQGPWAVPFVRETRSIKSPLDLQCSQSPHGRIDTGKPM